MQESARILCVDDEKNVLRALERTFLDEDYEILTAVSGEEGLKILRERQPVHIIISDYRMPGMNGIEFLKEVCDGWPDTIRIVLSGYTDTGTIIDAINEGQIFKFIPKPWDDDEFRVTIAKAADHYFLRKKNEELTDELRKANAELLLLNENLEKMVEERTGEMPFRSEALIAAQNILEVLPMALLGLDTEGQIVQCNHMGEAFFAGRTKGLLGRSSNEVLPPEMMSFIQEIPLGEKKSAQVIIDGRSVTVKGVWFEGHGGQWKLILVMDVGEF